MLTKLKQQNISNEFIGLTGRSTFLHANNSLSVVPISWSKKKSTPEFKFNSASQLPTPPASPSLPSVRQGSFFLYPLSLALSSYSDYDDGDARASAASRTAGLFWFCPLYLRGLNLGFGLRLDTRQRKREKERSWRCQTPSFL